MINDKSMVKDGKCVIKYPLTLAISHNFPIAQVRDVIS